MDAVGNVIRCERDTPTLRAPAGRDRTPTVALSCNSDLTITCTRAWIARDATHTKVISCDLAENDSAFVQMTFIW